MSTTSLAVDTLDRLAVQLSGIQEAAKQLRDFGSYEGAIEELKAVKARTLKEIEVAKAELADVKQRSAEAVATAKDAADRMKAMASADMEAASGKAKQIIRDAEAKAAEAITHERNNAQASLAEIQRLVAEEEKKLVALREKATLEAEKMKVIESRTDAAQQALESIQAAIQAQAKAMAG